MIARVALKREAGAMDQDELSDFYVRYAASCIRAGVKPLPLAFGLFLAAADRGNNSTRAQPARIANVIAARLGRSIDRIRPRVCGNAPAESALAGHGPCNAVLPGGPR